MADRQIWFTALRRNFPDLQVWTLTFRGNLCSFMTYVHCKFTSLKGSSVRGTKATGLYKHCRYFVNMTHYDVEFRCLLLENLDNVAQLLPGAYVSELHITERRGAVPVQQNAHPSASGQSAVTPSSSVHYDADPVTTFALPRIPFAAFNYPRVSPPVQTADEQLRCDLTDNESWGTADPILRLCLRKTASTGDTGASSVTKLLLGPRSSRRVVPPCMCPVVTPMCTLSGASTLTGGPGHADPATRGIQRPLLLRPTTCKQRVPPRGRYCVARTVRATFSVESSPSLPATGVPC
jgi:hypothetical protein